MNYLAETLHELNKEKKKNKIEVPKCPSCGEGMVFTFAFPRMEYACLPCNETDEFFPRNEMIEVSEKEHDKKKKLWSKDLEVIAFRGGARCGKNHPENEVCKKCKLPKERAKDTNYKFKFWKSKMKK